MEIEMQFVSISFIGNGERSLNTFMNGYLK